MQGQITGGREGRMKGGAVKGRGGAVKERGGAAKGRGGAVKETSIKASI